MIARILFFCGIPTLLWLVCPSRQQMDHERALATVLKYSGVELYRDNLEAINSLSSALDQLNKDRNEHEPATAISSWYAGPQFLCQLRTAGRSSCFFLIKTEGLAMVPGSTDLRIQEFDQHGKFAREFSFTTGWRRYLRSYRLQSMAPNEPPLIVLSTETNRGLLMGPEKNQKQYYAKIDDRLDLIRIENSDQKLFPNNYAYEHFRSGPAIPKQSGGQWEADLWSPERHRVLRALNWLGSVHRGIENRERGGELEPDEDVKMVSALRARPSVRRRVSKLAESKDLWIAQAAKLVLSPPRQW